MKNLYIKLKEKLSDPIINLLFSTVASAVVTVITKNLIIGIIVGAIILFALTMYLIWKENREKYYHTLEEEGFKDFTTAVMKRYYGEKYFTILNNDTIPVYCMPVSKTTNYEKSIRDFDKLCNEYDKCFSHFNIKDHQISFFNMVYQKYKYYRNYYFINGLEIKRPNHPGFMLEKISTNNDGEIEKINNISVRLGSYAENVYTSDILEYELYKAYLRFEKDWEKDKNIEDDSFWNKIKGSLEIRNKISEANNNECNSLFNGKGRESLISVQMIVVYKDSNNEYKVHMIMRSEDVAQAPGEYQLVPCGGFDILNELKPQEYTKYIFKENLSPGACAFREYLEEVIVGKEFKEKYEGQGEGGVDDLILKDTFVRDICNMLDDKKATLQFLGSSVSLVLLRHTLSFALIIHDNRPFHKGKSYSGTVFSGNHESVGREIYAVPVSDVENEEYWKGMNVGSKASWYLFTQTEEYKKIAEDKK